MTTKAFNEVTFLLNYKGALADREYITLDLKLHGFDPTIGLVLFDLCMLKSTSIFSHFKLFILFISRLTHIISQKTIKVSNNNV